jgi:hypothetical protein
LYLFALFASTSKGGSYDKSLELIPECELKLAFTTLGCDLAEVGARAVTAGAAEGDQIIL